MKLNSFFSQSTRAFYQEANTSTKLTKWQKVHAYIYLKWVYLYISIGTGEHPLTKAITPIFSFFNRASGNKVNSSSFADSYHGKVVTTKSARQLIKLNRKIELRELEQVIPYTQARDIVLTNPEHIAVLDCPCRVARKKPCTPIDVCIIIGEPFVGFVLEHHPSKARKITSEEAEEILDAEHKRGHVHHAFFKDAMLNRFYAICNCCSCCCGAMQAFHNGNPMLCSSGYICTVDEEKCLNCGLCIKKCQFSAIRPDDKRKTVLIDYQKCMGCGACISSCKVEALTLVEDPAKGMPLEIHNLLEDAAKTQQEN